MENIKSECQALNRYLREIKEHPLEYWCPNCGLDGKLEVEVKDKQDVELCRVICRKCNAHSNHWSCGLFAATDEWNEFAEKHAKIPNKIIRR